MPATYEPIASQTLGSDTATVTFSSIPGTFTDLVLVTAIRGAASAANQDGWFRFNSDSGGNYSRTVLAGNGTSVVSIRNSNMFNGYGLFPPADTATANVYSADVTHIMSYANTNVFKTYIQRGHYLIGTLANVGLWRSTAAITSIQIGLDGGNLKSGSTFSLYGIKAA